MILVQVDAPRPLVRSFAIRNWPQINLIPTLHKYIRTYVDRPLAALTQASTVTVLLHACTHTHTD